MRGVVIRRLVEATEYGNENQIYDLLSPAYEAAGALAVINWKLYMQQKLHYENLQQMYYQ